MTNMKEIKSIELSSFTLSMTGIAVIFSLIFSIAITIGMTLIQFSAITIAIYLIPTIVVCTLMYSIYNTFMAGFLYNTLGKKLNVIKFELNKEQEIVKISTTETAIMISIITAIQAILIYLASMLLVPLFLNSIIQTLLFSGQQILAFTIYQFAAIITQPTIIAILLFGTFIMTFIFVLIGCFIYNALAKRGRGVKVDLSKENEYTAIESIDALKFAIAFGLIAGIINLILVIISLITGGSIISAIINIVGGFISGIVEGALFAIFYNFLAPRLGKIKLELID